MKKLYYIAYAISGLVVLSILLPWIHSNNTEYYVYGYTFRAGSIGLTFIIISDLLLAFKKDNAAIVFSGLSFVYGFSFIFGWINRASEDGTSNVFEGLQIGLFLFLISLLSYTITIWVIKNKRKKLKSNVKEKKNPDN